MNTPVMGGPTQGSAPTDIFQQSFHHDYNLPPRYLNTRGDVLNPKMLDIAKSSYFSLTFRKYSVYLYEFVHFMNMFRSANWGVSNAKGFA